jgi:glycosyltransferase involved in cell wall biosynthesis
VHVFVAGYPKDVGGANTELWHTLKLWRGAGIDVTLIPTWPENVEDNDPWQAKVEGLGCRVALTEPVDLHRVPGLPDSIVVSFCNTRFLEHAGAFQGLGCRVVWANCMCWPFPQERRHLQTHDLFDRYVFQSEYQRRKYVPELRKHGYVDAMGRIIRGAFDPAEFPERVKKHPSGERFIIGRLSRTGPDKFPPDLWAQYAKIPHPASVRVMGWSLELEDKCGQPPTWAETLPERRETAQDFLASIHALVPGLDATPENWPRVGLEAMAAAVPIVAEKRGGWCEMLDGAGVLVDSSDEQAYQVGRLAYDEQHRMGVICEQHRRLTELIEPERIAEQWLTMFREL